jgi:AsmA protein
VFDSIYSNIDVADGKARTDDFLMDSKRVDVGAKGYVDIIENSVDMVTSVSLPRGKTAVEKVLDEPLFVHVYGPFTALQYDIDTDKLQESTVGALEAEAKAKLEAEKAKLKAKADAEKARLKAKAEAEKAKLKAKADAEKARLKALEEEEKRKAEEKAKQELKETTEQYEDKLKDKLKGLF